MQTQEVRMTLRLPLWAAAFLDAVGKENFTSRNAEIVRSIKERMQAATGAGLADTTPAAALSHTAVEAGGQFHPQHQEC